MLPRPPLWGQRCPHLGAVLWLPADLLCEHTAFGWAWYGLGWAFIWTSYLTQAVGKFYRRYFCSWCFDPCVLYCSSGWGWDLFLVESCWGLVLIPFQAEGRTCLEVLDSVEEKKIPVKWLSHLGKIFSSIKTRTVLKVGAWNSAKENQTIGGVKTNCPSSKSTVRGAEG